MDIFGKVDSKYRFVILASKRAKQLLKGAKPKIKGKSRNLIRIAQAEVKSGLIDFEVLPEPKDEVPEMEDRVFVGGEGLAEDVGDHEPELGKEPGGEEAAEEGVEGGEAGEVEEESDEASEDDLKEDKED